MQMRYDFRLREYVHRVFDGLVLLAFAFILVSLVAAGASGLDQIF